jgi:hypothetical protein
LGREKHDSNRPCAGRLTLRFRLLVMASLSGPSDCSENLLEKIALLLVDLHQLSSRRLLFDFQQTVQPVDPMMSAAADSMIIMIIG